MTRMSKADCRAWQAARTLADLGELTAQWLEGRIASQPGYCGPSDIEDPALVPLLARLNRAGFVTTGSQIGETGPGWEQRAAVEGFADEEMARLLQLAAIDAGLTCVLHAPDELPRWRYRYGKSVTVTRVNGARFTGFGVQIPRRHIRDAHLGYGMCDREAVDAIEAAWQVTIIDPEWGRTDVLWRVLEQAIQPGHQCRTGGQS